MITPETPIGPESQVTLGVVWTVVGALIATTFTLVVWVQSLLKGYVKRDVFDEIQKSRALQMERIEEVLGEIKTDLREIRRNGR